MVDLWLTYVHIQSHSYVHCSEESKGAKASGIDIFITKAMVWSNWCTVGLNSVANSQLPPQSHDQNSKPLAKHNVKVAKVQQMLEKVSASSNGKERTSTISKYLLKLGPRKSRGGNSGKESRCFEHYNLHAMPDESSKSPVPKCFAT